jgi:YidC/Oxa1 family membrane protein insertase
MFALFGACVAVAYHLVSGLARIIAPLAGGLAPVLAIIACTAAVRLLLVPLSYYSLRGQASQARLLPQVQELQQRHAGHPDRLQRELSLLYKEQGTGLLGGCLPALLQLPFFSVLYRLLESRTIDARPNSLLSHDLLGAPLGSHWLGAPGLASAQGAVFLGLFVLLAVVGWLSARSARRFTAAAAAQSGRAATGSSAATGSNAAKGRKAASPTGAAQPGGAVGLLTRALPYTTVAVAAVVPLAAGLYLLTSSAWAAAERRLLRRKAAQSASAGPPRRDRQRGGDVPGVIRSA